MLFGAAASLGLAVAPGAALAAATPQYAPPAAWVKPLSLPAAPPASDGAETRALLYDAQQRLGPDSDANYYETATRVETSDGLDSAGVITLNWQPDTETLVIHKVRIIRDGHVIDALAGGKTFTVLRRETNLEMAMLDGQLTATLQLEGLEVGDTVDYAYSIITKDPVMQGRSEGWIGVPEDGPTDHFHVRAVWAGDTPVRWRLTEGMAKPVVTHKDGESEFVIDMTAAKLPAAPAGAPDRYSGLGQVELTDFPDWQSVSILMAPGFDKAVKLNPDSPLVAEAAKIAAASSDPKVRASAALRLVEDKVRYLFLAMDQGGLVPASADETWRRRFGDCKAKTVLLIALLRQLGIEAEPALVSTNLGDGLDARLPMVQFFDHVIVRATIGGRIYWLDGTASGDRDIELLEVPSYRWALPVRAAGAALEPLDQKPPERPTFEMHLKVDASKGLYAPAAVNLEMIERGSVAAAQRAQLAVKRDDDRDKYLRDMVKGSFPWIEPEKLTAEVEEATGEVHIAIQGRGQVTGREFNDEGVLRIRLAHTAHAPPELAERNGSEHADAPYAVEFGEYDSSDETLILPRHGEGFTLQGEAVDRTVGGIHYVRKVTLADGVVTAHASKRALAREIPATEADAVAAARGELTAAATVTPPIGYNPGPAEIAAMIDQPATTAAALTNRGFAYFAKGDQAHAIADLDAAAKLAPHDTRIAALRGWSLWASGKADVAVKAFDEALKYDDHNVGALLGRGMVRQAGGDTAAALADYSRALVMTPNSAALYRVRAEIYETTKQPQRALADYDEAVRLDPAQTEYLFRRAWLLVRLKEADRAAADMDAAVALAPKSAGIVAQRAYVLAAIGRRDDALAGFSASLALKPTVYAYLGRARVLHLADRGKGFDDVNAALKLDPNSVDALKIRAGWLGDAGRTDEALADAERVLKLSPGEPSALNARCWARATAGRELDGALADCNAALKTNPDVASFLDSRGFTHFRRGEFDLAIADYDAALAKTPGLGPSLFGRGLAELRKGDTEHGQADLAAARKAQPDVDAMFAAFGVKP